MRKVIMSLWFFILTACTSGSDESSKDNGNNSTQNGDSFVSFMPNLVSATYEIGDSARLLVTATINATLSGTVYVHIIDSAGVITPDVSISPSGNGSSYTATIMTSPTIAVGNYQGDFELRLCRDIACNDQFPGSPALLPFDITVTGLINANIVLTPDSLPQDVRLEGDSISIAMKASYNTALKGNAIKGNLHASMTDSAALFRTHVPTDPTYEGGYLLNVDADALVAGHYQGEIEFNLCADPDCKAPYPGSPVSFPYDLRVLASTNLTPLSRWENINDWETVQGNASHTGYIPVTLDPAKFSPRWRWIKQGGFVKPVVTANGLTFAAWNEIPPPSKTAVLYALNEYDSSTQWKVDFKANTVTNSFINIHSPAVSDGSVFLGVSNSVDSAMHAYAADTGLIQFTSTANPLWSHAFTAYGGSAYTFSSPYGRVLSFSAVDGKSLWSNTDFGATNFSDFDLFSDVWTPAVDQNHVYAFMSCGFANDGLFVINRTDGKLAFSINEDKTDGHCEKTTAALGSSGGILVKSYNKLTRFDIAERAISWVANGVYDTPPTLAGDTLFIANGKPLQLEARSESDGTLLWSWAPPHSDDTFFYGAIVATENMVFISTNKRVYAINRNSHEPEWMYWGMGDLAVSANGLLYIATKDTSTLNSDGGLTAINLQ